MRNAGRGTLNPQHSTLNEHPNHKAGSARNRTAQNAKDAKGRKDRPFLKQDFFSRNTDGHSLINLIALTRER
jgi:hypothetical protein